MASNDILSYYAIYTPDEKRIPLSGERAVIHTCLLDSFANKPPSRILAAIFEMNAPFCLAVSAELLSTNVNEVKDTLIGCLGYNTYHTHFNKKFLFLYSDAGQTVDKRTTAWLANFLNSLAFYNVKIISLSSSQPCPEAAFFYYQDQSDLEKVTQNICTTLLERATPVNIVLDRSIQYSTTIEFIEQQVKNNISEREWNLIVHNEKNLRQFSALQVELENLKNLSKSQKDYLDFLLNRHTMEDAELELSRFEKIKRYYHYEYEILPLWFKRFGHLIKVATGKRSFRSLFDDNVKKYKE
jgi:hypothetical protein